MLNFNIRNVFEQAIQIHLSHEQYLRHRLTHGRRILTGKLHSCSWFGSLFCCTNTTISRKNKDKHNRYTM